MKQAMVQGPGKLFLTEVPRPKVGPNDVLIEVAVTGVCGTDLAWRAVGGVNGPSAEPVALGHEFAGTIAETGSRVTSFKMGDRVAYNSSNCPSDIGSGGPGGGFSPYVRIRNIDANPQGLVLVPDSLSLEHAALVEPLAAAMHAVNKAAPQPGESVAVFGAGPVGLGVVLALRWQGIDDIAVFDPSKRRRAVALSLGARTAFNPIEVPPAKALSELRGEKMAAKWHRAFPRTDVVIEASGAPGVFADIVNWANLHTRIVLLSTNEEPLAFDGNMVMGKELSIVGAVGYPVEFPEVMDKLSEAAIDVDVLISHRFPLEETVAAFDQAQDSANSLKVLVEMSGD